MRVKATSIKMNIQPCIFYALFLIGYTDAVFSDGIIENGIGDYELKSGSSIIDAQSDMVWFLQNASLSSNTLKINTSSIGIAQNDGVVQKIVANGNPVTFLI